jgi:K+-transporting ATPase ATPase A chain
MSAKKTWLDPMLVPPERLLYRLTGVDPDVEMRWTEYAVAMLVCSSATILLTYAVERLQHAIPLWNP